MTLQHMRSLCASKIVSVCLHTQYICIHNIFAYTIYLHTRYICIHNIFAYTIYLHTQYIRIHNIFAYTIYLHTQYISIHDIFAYTIYSPIIFSRIFILKQMVQYIYHVCYIYRRISMEVRIHQFTGHRLIYLLSIRVF
jgi:hypothetical protein